VLEEHHLIPYQVSAIPAGPWIVFAPHADDETFGMGGALLLAKDAGIETHVIVMTDGALGGDKDDLVAIRKAEVTAVCDYLGIESLQCWDQQDRNLQVSQQLIKRIKRRIDELRPAAVFFPAPMEPHPDHRNTAQLVWQSMASLYMEANNKEANEKQSITSSTLPLPQVFAYEISVQSPINRLWDISAVMPRKRQAMLLYNSQNQENAYPDLVVALNKTRTFSLPEAVEYAEGYYQYSLDQLTGSLQHCTEATLAQYW